MWILKLNNLIRWKLFFLFFMEFLSEIECACRCCADFLIPKAIDLENTSQPASATLMYEEHGVSNKNHVCESIYGTTSILRGYAICQIAINRLFPNEKLTERVKCLHVIVQKGRFKHSQYKASNNRNYHPMVRCVYGEGNKYFYIFNGPKDFYYVVEIKQELCITHCLKIQPTHDDYPKIGIEATNDPQKADDIFGTWGSIALVKHAKKHVCMESEKDPKYLVGREICQKLFDTEEMKALDRKFLESAQVICVHDRLKRKIDDYSTKRKPFSSMFHMVKCYYYHKDIPKSVMILNTPKRNLYYIAENDDKGSDDEFIVKYILNIS